MTIGRRIRAGLAVLAMLLIAAPAMADCYGGTSDGSLETVPSTQTGQSYTTVVGGGLVCDGSTLALLHTPTFIVTLTGTTHDLALENGQGDRIPYTVYLDDSYQTPLAIGQTINLSDVQVLDLLNLFTAPNGSVPFYIRTSPARFLSAGTYTDTLHTRWYYQVCSGVAIGGLCIGQDSGTIAADIVISQQITRDCLFTAPDINFGSAPLVTGFAPVHQTLALYCTKGSTYQVELGPGLHGDAGQRYMASGDDRLAYDIYQPDGTRWGEAANGQARASTSADTRPGPGLGGGPGVGASTAQGFNYTARIEPDQPTPPAGHYSDRILVTVRF